MARGLSAGPVSIPPEFGSAKAQVRARVILSAICRSDLREIRRERDHLQTFGHEVVAEVVESSGVPQLYPGYRFVLDPHARVSRTSGFSTHLLLWGAPEDVTAALRFVPPELPPDLALWVEPLACALNCVVAAHTNAPAEARKALVYGAGTYGTIIATLLRSGGLDVTITNRTGRRLEWLRSKAGPWSRGITFTGLEDLQCRQFDLIVDASASVDPATYPFLASLLNNGGQIHVFGGTHARQSLAFGLSLDGIRRKRLCKDLVYENHALRITGSHEASNADFDAAVQLILENRPQHDYRFLHSAHISLGDLVSTLGQLDKSTHYGKPIVFPSTARKNENAALIRHPSRVDLSVPAGNTGGPVTVEPLIVGLCGTDVQMLTGERRCETPVLGHEMVARVAESRSPDYRQGDIVVANPVRKSEPSKVLGHSVPGALQERLAFSSSDIEEGALITYKGPLELGPLVEPLACVFHGMRVTGLVASPVKAVAVIGDGALGLMTALIAEGFAEKVTLFTKASSRKVKVRRALGGQSIAVEHDPYDSKFDTQFDVVFNCTTRASAKTAIAASEFLLRSNGILDMVSGVDELGVGTDSRIEAVQTVRESNVSGMTDIQLIQWEARGKTIQVTGHRGASDVDFESAQTIICRSPEQFRSLIGATLQFAEAAVHMEKVISRASEFGYFRGPYKTLIFGPSLAEHAPEIAAWRPQFKPTIKAVTL